MASLKPVETSEKLTSRVANAHATTLVGITTMLCGQNRLLFHGCAKLVRRVFAIQGSKCSIRIKSMHFRTSADWTGCFCMRSAFALCTQFPDRSLNYRCLHDTNSRIHLYHGEFLCTACSYMRMREAVPPSTHMRKHACARHGMLQAILYESNYPHVGVR